MQLHPAYSAGFFDGEGCLTIIYRHARSQVLDPSKKIMVMHLVASVASTDERILRFFVSSYGGNLTTRPKSRTPNHKPIYQWHLTGKDNLQIFLAALKPYAIVKLKQIEIGFQFLETVGAKGHRLTQEEWTIRVELYERIRFLNRRGVFESVSLPSSPPGSFSPREVYSPEILAARMAEARRHIKHSLMADPSPATLRARVYRARKKHNLAQ